ncbi:uncharacterized protein LOC143228465 [Tachypleus tridentatus]|uniref:uncharacterized protein LOC143228465 n=1 Tax=Tachypleus tridentatus TaxID=6853 RepID=UPI003FD6022A
MCHITQILGFFLPALKTVKAEVPTSQETVDRTPVSGWIVLQTLDSSSGVEKTLTEDECGDEELTVGMEMLEEFSSSKYQKGSSKDSFYNQFKADGVELCLSLWLRKRNGC